MAEEWRFISDTMGACAAAANERRTLRASAGGVVALLFIVGFLFLLIPLAVVKDARTVSDRYWLDHHGVAMDARVVGRHTDYSDNEDGTFYVDAAYGSTTTTLQVGSEDHVTGSHIHLRVDPADPTHAIAIEDPPVPSAWAPSTCSSCSSHSAVPPRVASARGPRRPVCDTGERTRTTLSARSERRQATANERFASPRKNPSIAVSGASSGSVAAPSVTNSGAKCSTVGCA